MNGLKDNYINLMYIGASRNLLTNGKIYTGKIIEVGDKLFFRIINNYGEESAYWLNKFISREEYRNKVISNILD